MLRLLSFIAVVGLAAAVSAAGPCEERLTPEKLEKLPVPAFLRTRDVSWVDPQRLAFATSKGIQLRPASGGSVQRLPADIQEVIRVASDGKTLVASNFDYTDVAVDVRSGKMTHHRRRYAMSIRDIAVAGPKVGILGFPVRVEGVDFGNVWTGPLGAAWEKYTLLEPAGTDKEMDYLRLSFPLYSGAVAMAADGTTFAVTHGKPGVARYVPDGRRAAALGRGLTELVVRNLPETTTKYGKDPLSHYTEILNRQPFADDLVLLPEGPAIVVRQFARGTIWWELWFPNETKTRRRVRLMIDQKQIAGGHLRCDARGTKLACVFGKLVALGQPEQPHLALFDLKSVKRSAACK